MPTREQVIEAVTAYVNRSYAGNWRQAFDFEDDDRDGKLTVSNVSAVLSRAGVGTAFTRWPIAKEIVRTLDGDRDGKITFAEFAAITNVTSFQGDSDMANPVGATPVMASVGLSLVDVQEVAQHVVRLLETQGETALRVATNMLKLVKAVSGRDMLTVFTLLNAVTVDVQALVAAVKAEFELN